MDVIAVRTAAGGKLDLAARVLLFILILFAEKFLLTVLVIPSISPALSGFSAHIYAWQDPVVRFVVAAAFFIPLFAYARSDRQRLYNIHSAASLPIKGVWLTLHFILMLGLWALSIALYKQSPPLVPANVILGARLIIALGAVLTLFMALVPWRLFRDAAKWFGPSWLYALSAALLAVVLMHFMQTMWQPTATVTLIAVKYVLGPFIPHIHADPHTLVLESSNFAVRILPPCSGLEGIGLLLAFCGAWLLSFRKEYSFPQALVLLPAAAALSFTLNIVRLAAMMCIGYAGFPAIAMYGFHSEAGWVAFIASAGLIAIGSRRIRWISVVAHERPSQTVSSDDVAPDNPTAVYLLPFLLTLAAGILARAVSSGFETLYFLQPLAASGALVWAWPRLRRLSWDFSWRATLVGTLVFVVWICAAHIFSRREAMPTDLAAMPGWERLTWIASRAGGAILIVPFTEELAFRGWLMRRIVASDFESVAFRNVTMMALLLSAVAFGLEHGAFWLPGIFAGLMYGALSIWSQRFGDAVVAHATTNALLAIYVLHWNQWQLW